MPSRRGRVSRKTWGMGGGVRPLGHLPGAVPPCHHLLPPSWVCSLLELHRWDTTMQSQGCAVPCPQWGSVTPLYLPVHTLQPSTLLTSLTQSDMTWVLGVRKWKLRTTTQITTMADTSSMIKSRYLWRTWTWSWHCHRGWAQAELPASTLGTL